MIGKVHHQKSKGPRAKWFLGLMLILVLAGQVPRAYATPTIPVLLVNHALKQCIDNVIMADECWSCKPKEGWQTLPRGQCPSGYEVIPSSSTLGDRGAPISCAAYPNSQSFNCGSGDRYPTMTIVPKFSTVTVAPSSTVTAQQPTVISPTPFVAPAIPALPADIFVYLFIFCLGCGILLIPIAGITFILIMRRRT